MTETVTETAERVDLFDLDREGLGRLVMSLGEREYRVDQLLGWLLVRRVTSFSEMTNLPKRMRRRLERVARIGTLSERRRTHSEDGMATKFLWELDDDQTVETVLMHYVDPADEDEVVPGTIPEGRHTICLSTQAGCAMGCVFCATGQMGLVRDLTRGECVEQVVRIARELDRVGQRVDNVVFMGMGEPLANWPATRGTIEMLTDEAGMGMSPRRITVSTVGIVPGIDRLARWGIPVRLAVSLHAPDDELRSRLVAVNRLYPLDDILAACRRWLSAGGRRITFEYVLIRGLNDHPDQARALAERLVELDAHVNLIPLNPTPGTDMRPSRYDDAAAFADILREAGIPTNLRMRRGIEIRAGCGQLRARDRDGTGRIGRTIELDEAISGARPGLPVGEGL